MLVEVSVSVWQMAMSSWTHLSFLHGQNFSGTQSFSAQDLDGALKWHAGPCGRCEMVCTDQDVGKRGGPEPLLTLAAYRRIRGRIHFGILLSQSPAAGPGHGERLQVGAPLHVDNETGAQAR